MSPSERAQMQEIHESEKLELFACIDDLEEMQITLISQVEILSATMRSIHNDGATFSGQTAIQAALAQSAKIQKRINVLARQIKKRKLQQTPVELQKPFAAVTFDAGQACPIW